jgi:hypothetical protein
VKQAATRVMRAACRASAALSLGIRKALIDESRFLDPGVAAFSFTFG